MPRFAAIVLALLALAVAAAAPASAAWKPGDAMYASERDVEDLLEQAYDFANCRGIPRYGHRGEFPSEEFLRFECSLDLNGVHCYGSRYRSVKFKRPGYFTLARVSRGNCY